MARDMARAALAADAAWAFRLSGAPDTSMYTVPTVSTCNLEREVANSLENPELVRLGPTHHYVLGWLADSAFSIKSTLLTESK